MADKSTEVIVLSNCKCEPGIPIPKGGLPDYFERARPCAVHFAELWKAGERNFAVHLNERHVIAVAVDGALFGNW